MWMRLGVILVGSFLIGFLLELPAGLLAKPHTWTLGGSGEQGRVQSPFRWKAHFGLAKRVFLGAGAHGRDAAGCLGGSEQA
jgi:hypothetical protein